MKKLFEKDEVWFAVIWIVVYVVGFGNADMLSESIGVPKLLTCILGLILSVVLWRFIKTGGLSEYYGLCGVKTGGKELLWFVPLIVITSVNLWNGVAVNGSLREIVLHIISMCFVGFLEEVIFRGLLFKGMSKTNVTVAIVVSSLTFGVGHIVNLLMGAPVPETLMQLIYASAIGFCYTAVFFVSGSILPCIISHGVFNSLSIFAVETTLKGDIIITVVQTVLSTGYGFWLLMGKRKREAEKTVES